MSRLSPALETELRQDAPLVFGALAIDLPSYNLSLLDGAGILSFDGRTYVGEDATFGTLSDIEELEDGTGDSAPAIAIGLLPSGDAAAAALAGPAMQGSKVAVYFGARNATTGQVVGTELVFLGELDVPTLQAGDRGRRLDYEVVSVFERLFEDDESARLSPGHHRSIFPNEAGMDYVTGVDQPVYWGVAGNPSPVVTGSGGVNYSLGSYLANK